MGINAPVAKQCPLLQAELLRVDSFNNKKGAPCTEAGHLACPATWDPVSSEKQAEKSTFFPDSNRTNTGPNEHNEHDYNRKHLVATTEQWGFSKLILSVFTAKTQLWIANIYAGHKLLLAQTSFPCVIILIFNRKINYIDFYLYASICKFPYKRGRST